MTVSQIEEIKPIPISANMTMNMIIVNPTGEPNTGCNNGWIFAKTLINETTDLVKNITTSAGEVVAIV